MSFQLTHRSLIRHYIKNMLSNHVDVGGRVFVNMVNSPIFVEELPCVNVTFSEEPADNWVGISPGIKSYKKNMQVVITVVVAKRHVDGDGHSDYQRSFDYLDSLSESVEACFNDDSTLARDLPDFDAEYNYGGLCHGAFLNGSLPYDAETETETPCIATAIRYTVPYDTDASADRRYVDFVMGTVTVTPGVIDDSMGEFVYVLDADDNYMIDEDGAYLISSASMVIDENGSALVDEGGLYLMVGI